MRKTLETALDRLLAAAEAVVADLDALDGDADLEPSLGAAERHPTPGRYLEMRPPTQDHWTDGYDRDDSEHEAVSEDEGAQCDDEGVKDNEDACSCEDFGGEYSLGAQEGPTGSEGWSTGGSPDHEPSLASTHSLDQRWWANHFLAAGVHLIDGEEEHDGCEPDDETDGREDLEPEEDI